MQHPDEILANIHMKHLKTLETYVCNMYVYATSRSTFATSRQNTCNICLEQMKHLEHTLETYVYSHYNMCNILISFCNIDIQHFQRTSETSETLEIYSYNIRFSPFLYRMPQHRARSERRKVLLIGLKKVSHC
jgi:hypothetical protein